MRCFEEKWGFSKSSDFWSKQRFLAKKGVFDESEVFPLNLENPEKGSKPRK
jgi:hypothetical protein